MDLLKYNDIDNCYHYIGSYWNFLNHIGNYCFYIGNYCFYIGNCYHCIGSYRLFHVLCGLSLQTQNILLLQRADFVHSRPILLMIEMLFAYCLVFS